MQLGLSENFNHFNHCHQTDISESIVYCNYNRVDQLLDIEVFMCFPHLSSISCVVFTVSLSLLQAKHMSQEPQVQQGGDLFRLDGFLNAWLSV